MNHQFWTKNDYSEKLKSLLKTGRVMLPEDLSMASEEITDFEVHAALALLEYAAQQKPSFLLKEIKDNIFTHPHMLSPCLAMLAAQGNDNFLLNHETKQDMHSILSVLDPAQILEFVEYLKPKIFGRGFGSRPQKLVRSIMESWDVETLEDYIYNFESEIKSLVKAVHPRYMGHHGILIKLLFDKG